MTIDPFSKKFLRKFGITRVGELTGLDTIGIPVWFAARPNSRSLSVSQGKGLTDAQAKISAVMEAVESATAEQPRRHVKEFATIEDIARSGRSSVPFANLSRVNKHQLDPTRDRAWVPGHSLYDERAVLAPYEIIGTDMRCDMPWDHQAFRMTSQGLAAGFDRDAAVEHALLELIEFDASHFVDQFDVFGQNVQEITQLSGHHADLDVVLEKLREAGLKLRVLSLPSRVGLPVAAAVITRQFNTTFELVVRAPVGVACRLDPAQAIIAAILEAVQSRLTDISGARDDIPEERYKELSKGLGGKKFNSLSMQDFVSLHRHQPVTSEKPYQVIVRKLRNAGISDAFVFDLATEVEGIHVVRALACDLEAEGGRFSELSMEAFLFSQAPLHAAC